jgi:xanthine dehydrogenase YagS FAD-binding subunit
VRPFHYVRPTDVAGALSAAATAEAAYLGGGTTLVDLMKLGVQAPAALIDVNHLTAPPAAITETTESPGGLRIPAAARNSDVAAHPLVRKRFPALAEALLAGASPQIRHMATVGGNLLQRTRCAYFRDVAVAECNKRQPGSGCAAQRDGAWTRMHAVLGGSVQCIAAHPSDMCVALLALDAVVHTRRPQGAERAMPIAELHTLPGAHPETETILERGELITHVTIPATPLAARSCYVKVRDRSSFAFALSSAAAALEISGGNIRAARLALGGVATRPWRRPEVEQALIGRRAKRTTYEKAAALALAGARPIGGNDFKVDLAKRTIVRALERAAESAA